MSTAAQYHSPDGWDNDSRSLGLLSMLGDRLQTTKIEPKMLRPGWINPV
jgi:hypothetical protein